jgi:ABC-2 type transport system ATP-binding protein
VRGSDTQVAAAAAANSSQSDAGLGSIFDNTIEVDQELGWADGIMRGTVGATSTNGLPLTYKVVSAPTLGGKVNLPTANNPTGNFTYLPYQTTLEAAGTTETFKIMVAETTGFDTFLTNLPILGLFVPSLLDKLYQTPILSSLLAPIIGSSQIVTFNADPYSSAAGRPTAFTYMMPSFDGTLISVNYFPAMSVTDGVAENAPTVLNGPGLGSAGGTDPDGQWNLGGMVPGIATLRTDSIPGYDGGMGGYNVVTWDPRGEFESGGRLQLDSPFWEGRDTSAIISWLTSDQNVARDQIKMESPDDPWIGMVGGSYGGGIQLAVAGTPDKRIDAIVPTITWNNLPESLYPNNTFKTGWGDLLGLALLTTGARINTQIYEGLITGNLFGLLSDKSLALIADSGSSILVNNIDIPTLFIQGAVDGLFVLNQAIQNAMQMTAANPDTPMKMSFGCFGHGVCLDPKPTSQDQNIYNLKWLDQYIGGVDGAAEDIPNFQWWDQKGVYHSSDLMPFDPAFNNPEPLVYQGTGGNMVLVPVLGGSGPASGVEVPLNFTVPTEAKNAFNVDIDLPTGTTIMGAPTLSFSYNGLGISRAVYAQLVDNATGRVVGNLVTPVPVTLDGQQHTVELPMEWIAYTSELANDNLTLQITSSTTAYEQAWAYGWINIGDIALDIPTVAGG